MGKNKYMVSFGDVNSTIVMAVDRSVKLALLSKSRVHFDHLKTQWDQNGNKYKLFYFILI